MLKKCNVEESKHQNAMASSLTHTTPFHQVLWKSVQLLLCNLAYKSSKKQMIRDKNITAMMWQKEHQFPAFNSLLERPWSQKYLYACNMFQCQDLTCWDRMKLPQCISISQKFYSRSERSQQLKTQITPSQKPVLPKSTWLHIALSVVTGIYISEWKKGAYPLYWLTQLPIWETWIQGTGEFTF